MSDTPEEYASLAQVLKQAAPFDQARALLATMAYPAPHSFRSAASLGTKRDGAGVQFYSSMYDYLLWVHRSRLGLSELRKQIGDSKLKLNKMKNWERTFLSGIERIQVAEASESAFSYAVGRMVGLDKLIKKGWKRGDAPTEPKPFSMTAALDDLPEFWAERLAIYQGARRTNPYPDSRDVRRTVTSYIPVFHIVRALGPIARESREWVPPEALSGFPEYGGLFPPNIHQHTPILLRFADRWVIRAIEDAERLRAEALNAKHDHSDDALTRQAQWCDIAESLIPLT